MTLRVVGAAFSFAVLAGCTTAGYYAEAVNGHFDLMQRRVPVEELLAKPDLDSDLRAKLELAQKARQFASRSLGLPDNDSYRSYADLGRPFVVWNVVATAPFSIEARTWCFWFAGCINYRGYFSEQGAEKFAEKLRQEDMDTFVAGARAYSTLGWFDDPLLSTMLDLGEARFVGIIFHELAHQQLYIDDDSMFNESFATAVEREGIKRWFLDHNRTQAYDSYLLANRRQSEFSRLLTDTRERLGELFKQEITEEVKRAGKQKIFAQLKLDYVRLKHSWNNYAGYDSWFEKPLNNARLALAATYFEYVPAFTVLIAQSPDWQTFYRLAAEIGALEKPERQKRLHDLARQANVDDLNVTIGAGP